MILYTVHFRSLPRMAFVCSLTDTLTDRNRNVIDHRQNMIEITLTSGCDRIVETETGRYLLPENTIGTFFPDERYVIYPQLKNPSAVVWSQSAAIVADDMDYTRRELDSLSEIDAFLRTLPPDTFVLPRILDPAETAIEDLHRLYHALCAAYMENTASGHLRCLAEWLRLCAHVDESFRSQIRAGLSTPVSEPRSAYYYVYKIKKRILTDLTAPLTLSEIAAELERSPDYIGKIFKSECGMGIREYVNRQRVMRLQDMICFDRERPLAALAAAAGFTDLRYAQRLFKQYTGVTMQRCRQFSGGLTLYHPNPWEKTNLDHDIYPTHTAAEKIQQEDADFGLILR